MASFKLSSPFEDNLSPINSVSDFHVFNTMDAANMRPLEEQVHPDFGQLVILVLSAVLEVVCVSLPGFIIAKRGMFDAEAQKFLANLNMMLFTPCLIFTKIASQLNPDKLADLIIIPVTFSVQILLSALGAYILSKVFRLHKRGMYFVIAMAVFGNSNSLPISLIVSLSKTLPSLRWDKIEGDNADEVAARGILYLLINQQLGQIIRWTVGYKLLLAPPSEFKVSEGGTALDNEENGHHIENGHHESLEVEDQDQSLLGNSTTSSPIDRPSSPVYNTASTNGWPSSGTVTPLEGNSSSIALLTGLRKPHDEAPIDWKSPTDIARKFNNAICSKYRAASSRVKKTSKRAYNALPRWLQLPVDVICYVCVSVWNALSPPLWAMIVALIVASVPQLQHTFFTKGTFLNTSITRAIEQSSGVAVPLILVVLGANLGYLPEENRIVSDPKFEKKLLWISMAARMLIPVIFVGPVIALIAKFVPISIVDDPVFVVVAFLLVGAPSALQLAQICQINDVYVSVMTKLLFQSYVIWILPSTLILVVAGIETVKWAEL